jgi:hypoxanthine-guanine phosphoribosyltransferase
MSTVVMVMVEQTWKRVEEIRQYTKLFVEEQSLWILGLLLGMMCSFRELTKLLEFKIDIKICVLKSRSASKTRKKLVEKA